MTTILIIISLLTYQPSRETQAVQPTRMLETQDSANTPSDCPRQPAAERESLMREAAESRYTIRRVEFLGNQYTRDALLRRRMSPLQEGNVFTRQSLSRSLASVNRLNSLLYPVKISDVTVHLVEQTKEVDLLVCFKERRRMPRG